MLPSDAVPLAEYMTEADAVASARRLVEHGIGAEVAFVEDAGEANLLTGSAGAHVVMVLPVDAARAREVLGIQAPGADERSSPPEQASADAAVQSFFGGRVHATSRQFVTMVALYLLALILIPLAVFWATRWLVSPEVDERPPSGQPTLPSSIGHG